MKENERKDYGSHNPFGDPYHEINDSLREVNKSLLKIFHVLVSIRDVQNNEEE